MKTLLDFILSTKQNTSWKCFFFFRKSIAWVEQYWEQLMIHQTKHHCLSSIGKSNDNIFLKRRLFVQCILTTFSANWSIAYANKDKTLSISHCIQWCQSALKVSMNTGSVRGEREISTLFHTFHYLLHYRSGLCRVFSAV